MTFVSEKWRETLMRLTFCKTNMDVYFLFNFFFQKIIHKVEEIVWQNHEAGETAHQIPQDI